MTGGSLRLFPDRDPGSAPSPAVADAHTVFSVEPAYLKEPAMSQPIVVGFDGSERSRDALVLARELASVLDSDLIVVDAYTPEEWL